jgi:hypothetical protein
VGRIGKNLGKGQGTVEYFKIPDLERTLAGKSSFNLVAGVRYEGSQKNFTLPIPFVVSRKECLPLAA